MRWQVPGLGTEPAPTPRAACAARGYPASGSGANRALPGRFRKPDPGHRAMSAWDLASGGVESGPADDPSAPPVPGAAAPRAQRGAHAAAARDGPARQRPVPGRRRLRLDGRRIDVPDELQALT